MLAFLIISFAICSYGQEYWNIDSNGFLPQNKAKSCLNPSMKDFCYVMENNPSTELIDYAASQFDLLELFFDPKSNTMHSNAVLEDTFHWLSISTCRIGYNQNPTGDNNGVPIRIPFSISSKLLLLSKYLNREPTTGYASMVLDNCEYIGNNDEDNDFNSYSNWNIQRTVTCAKEEIAHRAEKGFYASHCAVERAFGDAIHDIHNIGQILQKINSCDNSDSNIDTTPQIESIVDLLRTLAYDIRKTINSLKHMRHYFNPEHFFKDLRPFLKCGNIGDNGIIFEGFHMGSDDGMEVDIVLPNGTARTIQFDTPIYGFRGPTGAQTSSLPFIDSALQITTSISSNPHLEITMKEFRQYQPKFHYEFVNNASNFKLRDFVEMNSNDINLVDAYNDAVTSVAEWRYAHVDHVMTYIFKSIPHVPKKEVKGTGNTPIIKYLCESAYGTLKSRVKNNKSKNMPSISVPSVCAYECYSHQYDIHTEVYCNDFREVHS